MTNEDIEKVVKILNTEDKHAWYVDTVGSDVYFHRKYYKQTIGTHVSPCDIVPGNLKKIAHDAILYANNQVKNMKEQRKENASKNAQFFIPISQPRPVQITVSIPPDLKKEIECRAAKSQCSIDNFVAQAIDYAIKMMKG